MAPTDAAAAHPEPEALEAQTGVPLTEETNANVLYQILENSKALREKMDILLEFQESLFKDVESIGGDLVGLVEKVTKPKEGSQALKKQQHPSRRKQQQ